MVRIDMGYRFIPYCDNQAVVFTLSVIKLRANIN